LPEQKRLQAQFKDDRQALNQAIMEMYKENKVSPVGGCLPFLVQSPFFLALFGVLQGMSRVKYWVPTGQPFVEAQATGKVDGKIPEGAVAVGLPKHLPQDSSLYKSLFGTQDPVPGSNLPDLKHAPGEVKAFGFDLARSAAEMASKGFVRFLPYLLLIVLMIGLQVFAQRQVNRRNPAAAAANPQMQMITKVMPFLFGIFGWGFQAGLTLYWTTSSALRIVQQWALYRFDPTLAESVKEKKAELEREVGKGGAKATGDKARARKSDKAKTDRTDRTDKGDKGDKGAKPAAGAKAKPAADGGGKVKKPAPASGKGGAATKAAPIPSGNGKPAGAKPAVKAGGNGSGGTPSRPSPGRQQPKKRRKGR
ncbi:MAG: membrane protein insertase YidC, partial [Actinomycetes bacterium]